MRNIFDSFVDCFVNASLGVVFLVVAIPVIFVVATVGCFLIGICVAVGCSLIGIPQQAVIPIFLFFLIAGIVAIVATIVRGATISGNE